MWRAGGDGELGSAHDECLLALFPNWRQGNVEPRCSRDKTSASGLFEKRVGFNEVLWLDSREQLGECGANVCRAVV